MKTVVIGLLMLASTAPAADRELRERVLAHERERIETIRRITPACVCIYGEDRAGGGSGVIIDERGFGLTNFHVVAGMMAKRKGWGGLSDGELYELEVLGVDVTGDVAMIRLKGRDSFPVAELGDSHSVKLGDEVIAIGNPFTLAEDYVPTVTTGIVTGLHRYQGEGETLVYTDCIQTDASINPGNSGGPLFDADGRVVGINGRISAEMHKYARGRTNVGLGYAISINQVKRFIPHLRAGLLGKHGTLMATTIDDIGSVVFDNMYDNAPAWDAGIRVGDKLLRFGGQDIRSANHYASLLGTFPENWPVPVSYESGGRTYHKIIRLEPVDPPLKRPYRTPEEINREALKDTIKAFRTAVLGSQRTSPPRTWRMTWTRVAADGTHTTFQDEMSGGRSLTRTETSNDNAQARRWETRDGEVYILEGDKPYLADKFDALYHQAIEALLGRLLFEDEAWSRPGASHAGGDALVEIDDHGYVTNKRLLETIVWPVSEHVKLSVGLDLKSHLPARVVIRDDAANTTLEFEMKDYQTSGGISWPHRTIIELPSGTIGELLTDVEIKP